MTEFGKKLWRLYDSGQKSFYNDLNVIQLAKVVSTIPSDQVAHWFICENGAPDWTPLSETLKGFGELGMEQQTDTLVGLISESEDTSASAPGFDSLVADLQKAEKRQMGRIKTHIPVFIDVGSRILNCNISDISLMGLKLDQEFSSQHQGKYFPVILKTTPIINLRCMPLLDEDYQSKGTWNRMKIHPDYSLSQLADFLTKI